MENQRIPMTADFQEFQTRFDEYLRSAKEYPSEMYFLRYEAADQLRSLPSEPHDHDRFRQSLEEHHRVLDECQDYAVTREVTSTYVLFNEKKYTQWLDEQQRDDSRLSRAEWAREQIDAKEVTMHASNYATWFIVTEVASGIQDVPEILKDMFTEEKHATVR